MIVRDGSEPRPLIDSKARQYSPAIAAHGRGAFITWIERRSTVYELCAMPVDDEGAALLPAPIIVGPTIYSETSVWFDTDQFVWPAGLVWTGSAYMVVWTLNDGSTALTRFLPNGTRLDREPRFMPTENARPDHHVLTRFGDSLLWLWMQGDVFRYGCGQVTCTATYTSVHAMRLSTDGLPLDPLPLKVSASGGLPQVAVKDGTAIIIYEDFRRTMARRLSGSGTFLDAEPVPLLARRSAQRPSIARHGDGFLLSWQTSASIEAALMRLDLAVGLPYTLATDATTPKGPVAFTTENGEAGVAYVRVNADPGGVPRLYLRTFDGPPRTRAVRR
jgi:hypothetical protein